MAIKWNGWTAHPITKILSFLLIPALIAGAAVNLYLSFADTADETDFELLFVGYDNREFFFDQQLRNARYYGSDAVLYKDEKTIESGKYLRWRRSESNPYYYELWDTASRSARNWVDEESYDDVSGQRNELYQEAIQEQQEEYRNNKEQLERYSEQGLQYYIANRDKSIVLSNVNKDAVEYFATKPAFLIIEQGVWKSSSNDRGQWYSNQDGTIYMAYDQAAIDAITGRWQLVQADIWAKVMTPIFLVLCAGFCFVVLLAGTGRRLGKEKGDITFTTWDKPFLDIGFALLCLLELVFIFFLIELYWRFLESYGGHRQFVAFLTVVAVGLCTPILSWIVSVVKRIKAGKWWRHTLCYVVLHWLFTSIGSLWAGVSLTVKAVVIGAVLFGCILLCTALPVLSVVFSGVTLLALLRYFRRLHLVQVGADLASQGIYDPPIPVYRGELGQIAGSINNISAGVTMAVEAKMRSERMKTELITNVSHDIRTPLTSLITYTDLLKNEGLDSEKAPEYLEILTQKTQRMKTLVEELFEAAKASTGNVEVNLEELDLSALIRQCLGELDQRVQSSGLDFRLELPNHAPVLADGKLIWRVMENLLSNVFKYAMVHSRVYIDVTETGLEYRLDVKNMSADPLNMNPDELTERFTRGDTARSGEGSGLGLSIVQSFVQVQGGRFQLNIDGDLFKATIWLPQPAMRVESDVLSVDDQLV